MVDTNESVMEYLNSTLKHEDLKDYGKVFQHKLIYILMTDRTFLEQIYEILNESVFENEALVWLTKQLKNHFLDYKELLTIDVIKALIKEHVTDDKLKASIVQELKLIMTAKDTNNFDFVKDKAVSFFKYENMQQVLVDSFDLLDNREYDKIKNKIDDAMTAGENKRAGLDYVVDVDARYEEDNRKPIGTGFDMLDVELDGGLSYGELGVILAASSVGKSWFLVHMAVNAAKAGKHVVYYSLEDEEAFHAKRVDSILTGISTADLKYHRDAIKEVVKQLDGSITFKHFPQGVTTYLSFQSHITRLRLLGKEPDIIFVDYGDIMAPVNKQQSDWKYQAQIFDELKSFAQQSRLPLWTASQAKVGAVEKDIVSADDMAQAYLKVAPSNIILSLSRKINDKIEGTGRLFIAKNKYGRDSVTFPFKADHGRGKFEIFSQDTELGREMADRMKQGDTGIRSSIREKMQQMKQRGT